MTPIVYSVDVPPLLFSNSLRPSVVTPPVALPNLREASSNPSYRKMHPTEELRNKKKIEKILGKCGK